MKSGGSSETLVCRNGEWTPSLAEESGVLICDECLFYPIPNGRLRDVAGNKSVVQLDCGAPEHDHQLMWHCDRGKYVSNSLVIPTNKTHPLG